MVVASPSVPLAKSMRNRSYHPQEIKMQTRNLGLHAFLSFAVLALFAASGCSSKQGETLQSTAAMKQSGPANDDSQPVQQTEPATMETAAPTETADGLATATFASGCYWCTEAVFQRLEGVQDVVSGAMGGHVANPSYEQLCSGMSGHAECIQFKYDPSKVSYDALLEVFWKTHDPTTLNKQGADEGPQYRSAVFYHSEQQRELAEKYKAKLDEAGVFSNPIVTEITAASEFYSAKATHQNFYNSNPAHGYCSFVIRPKVEKLEAVFADKLKSNE